MSRLDTDDVGKPGKPPPKPRRFPWRLWLYAIVMTAVAAYAADYWWGQRQVVKGAEACTADLTKAKTAADDAGKAKDSCLSTLNDKIKQTKDLETQMAATAGNLSATKDELVAVRSQRADAEKRIAAIEDIQKQFAKMTDTGQLKVTARRGSMVLSLPAEVLFPSGVADLSKQGELAVLEVGITLKRFPERRFLVIGHADDMPLQNAPYKDNWDLSVARAMTVTKFLIEAGMSAKNLVPAGVGDNDPISKDRAKNRRIEIALLPAINELPPLPASLGTDTAAPKPEAEKPDPAKPADAPKPAAPAAPAAPKP